MRVSTRRVAKCSAFLFGILVVLDFVHDSPFFFNSSSSSSSLRKRISPSDKSQDPSQLKVDYLEKQSRSNGDLQMPGEGVGVGAAVGGTDKEKRQSHPAAVSSNYTPVYDWWEDLGTKYFRGERIPDDMLAMTPPRYLTNYKNPCFYVRDANGDIVLHGVHGDMKVRLKCLPYFHLIGVDKSGTTDLWFRLTQHSHVVQNTGVLGKETHWWSWRRFGFDIWVRNALVRHFDWYISHFDTAAKTMMNMTETRDNITYHPVITGEGSPTVFWDLTGWDLMPQNRNKTPETALVTPHCIHHLTPQAKLLLVLRNPVDRLYSEYLFLDRFKTDHNLSAELFHQGVQESIAMYKQCVQVQHSIAACLYNKSLHMILPVRIMVGMYSVWVRQWLKVFPGDQILILRNEDYAADTAGHLSQVFRFLELSPLSTAEMQKVAERKRVYQRSAKERAVGDMLPSTRQILTDFYRQYNEELADMLGDKRYLWL